MRHYFFSCIRLLALVAAAGSSLAFAQTADPALDRYAKPGDLIDIGAGRHLDLRCSGEGSATVLLEAGALADSMTWARVQPALEKSARACAYDRAGLGFSDGGPLPRDVDAAVADLHALIGAAHLSTPIVFVGHSLGTNIVRRYADRYQADVAGLVLVDPPPQNVGEFSPEFAKIDAQMRTQGLGFFKACEKAAAEGHLDSPPEQLKDCLRGANPAFSDTLNAAIRKNKIRADAWHTVVSVLETNGPLFDAPVPAGERHGAIPLVVLTADAAYADAPPADRGALEKAQDATHTRLVATSTRGTRVHVPGASHDLQMDHPQAVVDAVHSVLAQADAKNTKAMTSKPAKKK